MDGSVWVILPTYDEAASLDAVVGGIRAALPGAHVLVVDDNSRDGTGEIADRLAAEDNAAARRVQDVRPDRPRGGVAGAGPALRAAAVASAGAGRPTCRSTGA